MSRADGLCRGWKALAALACLTALPLSTAGATTPPVQGFQHQYRAQVGDLNADGRQDIYVRQVPRLLPVAADPPALVPKPDDVGEFVLQGTPSGNFSLVTALSSTQKATARQWPLRPGLKLLAHDYNADGLRDVLIGNVAAELPGAFDVIVYAGAARGAPPVYARNVDLNLQKFTRDVQGFLEDPYYFDPAISVTCNVQYRYVWVYYYDYGWALELRPYVLCYYVFDTAAFSIDAVEFLYYLVPFLDAGRMLVPSIDAMNVDRMLREVFGIEFLKGVLLDNGTDDTSADCYAGWPCPEYERLARIIDILIWLDRGTIDYCEAGTSHEYFVETRVCTVGASNCGTANVYKEQLSHPAPGYYSNITPVRDGQEGFAEIGVPGFIDNLGPVIFVVKKPELLHENVTTPKHVLHPGRVVRKTMIQGTGINILTHGSGTGGCKVANEVFGRAAFKAIDYYIASHISSGLVAVHPPVP